MADHFNPDEGSRVSKADAQSWIDKYDKEMRKDKDTDTRSIFYGKDVLKKLLDEPGSTGITFFLALKHSEHAKKEVVQLVLVSTTKDGKLLWNDADANLRADGGAGAFDIGTPCPPYCPT